MFCSTIITTIGREKINRAVQSMLNQNFSKDLFEIIVVNDSGVPLPEYAWQKSDQITILNTQNRERCFARNCAASISRGKFIHILDDDDWVGPNFLSDFYKAITDDKQKVLFYGSTQLVDRNSNPLIKLENRMQGNCFVQTMAGEWFPLQSALIRADMFFQIGGFNPMAVNGEDVDMLRQLALIGDFVEVQVAGSNVEVGVGQTTTDYDQSIELTRREREAVLDHPAAFKRLRESALNAEWHGRIFRIYLTSTIWNLRYGRYGTALGRIAYALGACLAAFPMIIQKHYWQAVCKPYESQTFLDGFKKVNLPVSRR